MNKLITYRVRKGRYNEVTEIKLKLPDKIKMLYNDGEIGHFCCTGFNHYMGFLKKSDYSQNIIESMYNNNNFEVEVLDFNDLYIFLINNISPIDSLPVYSPEEIMNEFKLNEYYISYKYQDEVNDVNGLWELFKNSQPQPEDINKFITEGKFYCSRRIKSIKGPYNVSVVEVYYDKDICSIEIRDNLYIDTLLQRNLLKGNIIANCSKSSDIFDDLYKQVINKIEN
jgi:hypothetical protein